VIPVNLVTMDFQYMVVEVSYLRVCVLLALNLYDISLCNLKMQCKRFIFV